MFARFLLAAAHGSGSFTPGVGMDLGWVSVKDHGAVGDGSNDDTSAIDTAISALPSPGVLYFPPGTYKTSGGHTISTPCLVLGMGGGGGKTLNYQSGGLTVPHISQLVCTSATAVLFTVSESGVQFHDLSMICSATATAGAAIQTVATGGDHARYSGLTISKFFNCIDHQYGREWSMDHCYLFDPVNDGLKMQNLDAADEGEVTITDCFFKEEDYDGNAGIEILRSGGYRIANCQFFGNTPHCFDMMIKATLSTATSNLIVSNNTFENYETNAIYVSGSQTWHNVIITANEFNDGRSSAHEAIYLSNVNRPIVAANVLLGSGQAYYAINMTNVSHGRLTGNYWEGYTGFLTGSSQTDITTSNN
jgi:hypothetical protein